MFVKTVKIKKLLKVLLTLLIIMAAVFAAVYAVNRLVKPGCPRLETEEDMLEFLGNLGWETSDCAINVRDVTVPTDWNEVYTRYNDLQKQQGFDLSGYKGKPATVYSFKILNYDGHPDNMVANLLICKGRLIAADISCTELGGFMQGIAPQSAA